MMKAKLRGAGWRAGMTAMTAMSAMAALTCYAATAAAYTMPGGTITFRGALVAPPFGVSTGAGELPGTFSSRNATAARNSSGQTVAVYFTPPLTSKPNAQVSIPAGVNARFTDGAGHRIARNGDGAFHIGATGGVLSISGAPAARVTVLTNYQ